MSITFPMWFIYLWAISIVLSFINAIISTVEMKSKLDILVNDAARLVTKGLTPVVEKAVTDLVSKEADKYAITQKKQKKNA